MRPRTGFGPRAFDESHPRDGRHSWLFVALLVVAYALTLRFVHPAVGSAG